MAAANDQDEIAALFQDTDSGCTQIVRISAGFDDREWMTRVAREDTTVSRTLFIPEGRESDALVFEKGELRSVRPDEQIPFLATPLAKPHTLWTPRGLRARIAAHNARTIAALTEQLRSPMSVIPFVGAGMSVEFGFPGWDRFLTEAAREEGIEITITDFEASAEALQHKSADGLFRRVKATFCKALDSDMLVSGPLARLVALNSGPVLTTNFDHVLEETFTACGRPFVQIVNGPKLDHIVQAIHQGRHALLKIHGDCSDRTDQTFAKWQYDKNWDGRGGRDVTLSTLARLMFTNRPLLFLGCSLTQDRTVTALQAIHRDLPGITHYAIMAALYSRDCFDERVKTLDDCGVSPIWFLPGDFGQINNILDQLIDGFSYRPAMKEKPLAKPEMLAIGSLPPFKGISNKSASSGGILPSPQRAVARAICTGKIVYFLGSYAHLAKIVTGNTFYQQLAALFDVPPFDYGRAAVASYIRDHYGPSQLMGGVKDVLTATPVHPSVVYQFIASLPAFVRSSSKCAALPQIVITTNYDTVMEESFARAEEPFHVFYYQSAGDDDGLFIHRRPDGTMSTLTRPENLEQMRDSAHIIVKLNGGLAYKMDIPESILIGRGDFERLAGKMPGVLPMFLRKALRQRSLLFLGHGLSEPDVEALVRFAGENRKLESWAVQLQVAPELVQYWASLGLQFADADLKDFMVNLIAELI